MNIQSSDALVVVDVQLDFCAGGALAVKDGEDVVPPINSVMGLFEHVVVSRDWHPPGHCSFDDEPKFVDGSWPAHCVADTQGAEFHPGLKAPSDALIVSKATNKDKEAYSDFEDTELAEQLRFRAVKRIFVCGLATDYCVKFTALDGVKNGFDVVLLEDACRGVDIPEGSAKAAIEEMKQAGVVVSSTGELNR